MSADERSAISEQAFDDAIAMLTESLGPINMERQLAAIRPITEGSPRYLAAVSMLAALGAAFVEALADATCTTPEHWLQGAAARNLARRNHGD